MYHIFHFSAPWLSGFQIFLWTFCLDRDAWLNSYTKGKNIMEFQIPQTIPHILHQLWQLNYYGSTESMAKNSGNSFFKKLLPYLAFLLTFDLTYQLKTVYCINFFSPWSIFLFPYGPLGTLNSVFWVFFLRTEFC